MPWSCQLAESMRKGESNPFCKNNRRNISCKADEFALHKIQYAKHMHTLNLAILIQPTLCNRKWTVLRNHYGCFNVGACEFQITQLALCHPTFPNQGSNGVHNQESPVCAPPLYKTMLRYSAYYLYIRPAALESKDGVLHDSAHGLVHAYHHHACSRHSRY